MILQTAAMPHQTAAIYKIRGDLARETTVGALFMDMGTGKSRVTAELAILRAQAGYIRRVVWFTPVTLKDNVRREITKHTGNAANIHVFDDKTGQGSIPDAFWYVIGIESMSASNRTVLAVHDLIDKQTMALVDESQYIKGHNSKRAERITLLSERAAFRLILSGTPVTQGIVDLFAQLKFLSPAILGFNSFYTFANRHLEYSERYRKMIVSSHNQRELAAKIAPYVYQVTKDECLQLPDKQYLDRYSSMTWDQYRDYERQKYDVLDVLSTDDGWESYDLFILFGRLQQIACGFLHIPAHTDIYGREFNDTLIEYEGHGRLPLLQTTVTEIAPHEPVIIWTKYRYCLRQIADTLRKTYGEASVVEYHGDLTTRQRAVNIDLFQAGAARFFVATPDSGGNGLTFVHCAYHIFYDNGFKYSTQVQAEDRSHRIGQTRKVTYISLWAECGIEQRIEKALRNKASLAGSFRREVERIKKNRDKKAMDRLVTAL